MAGDNKEHHESSVSIGRVRDGLKEITDATTPVYKAMIAPLMLPWAKGEGRWVTAGFGLCTLTVIGTTTYDFWKYGIYAPPGSKLRLYLCITFLLLLAAFFTTTRRHNPVVKGLHGSQRSPRVAQAVESANRFMSYWPFLWAIWFLLYAALSLVYILDLSTPFTVPLFNFLNNCTALVFFSMHEELQRETKEGRQQLWMPLLLTAVFVCILEVSLTAALSGAENATLLSLVQFLFQVVSGVVVGIATGLFASRLTSKVVDVPIAIIAVLVFYSVIQPIFPLIAEAPKGAPDIVTSVRAGAALVLAKLALYCKIFLIAVVHWLNDTGRLTYYMYGVRDLDAGAQAKMRDFLGSHVPKPHGRHEGPQEHRSGEGGPPLNRDEEHRTH